MTKAGRQRAYLLTAVAAVALSLVVTLLGGGTGERSKGDGRPQSAARVEPGSRPRPGPERTASQPPRGTEPPNPPSRRSERREAGRVAGRFLDALLRYEHGQREREVLAGLRASATAELVSELLRTPARGRRGVGTGIVRRLAVYGPFGGELKASATLSYPGLGDLLLELALERRAGRWRVTGLAP